MGSPVPPTASGECTECESVLWTPGNSPLFLWITFADIETCPAAPYAAPNGTFLLREPIGFPCIWEYVGTLYHIEFALGIGFTLLRCWPTGIYTKQFFHVWPGPACDLAHNNQRQTCGPATWAGVKGTGTLVIV